MSALSFRLKVQQVDQICLFELSWGQGQQLVATLNFPTLLTERYRDWKRVYLSFYKTVEIPVSPGKPHLSNPPLRGWAIAGGRLTPTVIDWHTKLVTAEITLLNEFHRWLRHAELFEIRSAIAKASRNLAAAKRPNREQSLDVFLCCTPTELVGLRQISSPNKAQRCFVSHEYVTVMVHPLNKTKRHRCPKRL